MIIKKQCVLTTEVETTSIWHNLLKDETGLKVLNESMPLLIDLYEKHEIETSFLFNGYSTKLYPIVIKMIVKYYHEFTSHCISHLGRNRFDIIPIVKQIIYLKNKDVRIDTIGNYVDLLVIN